MFIEHKNPFRNDTMVVMDGNRCVAVARKTGTGLWLLKIHSGSWTDPRARKPPERLDGKEYPKNYKSMFAKFPDLMSVPSKGEARKIMKELAATGGHS